MTRRPDPYNPPDDQARDLARRLLTESGHAALAFTDPASGNPAISRVALQTDALGLPVILVSALAAHTAALRANPACAFMLGEPGPKGDPMTSPRLMVQAVAEFSPADDRDRASMRAAWLSGNPKATVYIDLPDFAFCRLRPQSAMLNAGFGRAYRLAPPDLLPDR